MTTTVAVTIAALVWLAVLVRIRGLRRRAEPPGLAPRALLGTLVSFALGWTLIIPSVSAGLDRLTSTPLLGQLLTNLAGLTTGLGTQAMLMSLTYPEAQALRRLKPRIGAYAVAAVAMVVAFAVARPEVETRAVATVYGRTPFYAAYFAPYLLFIGYAFASTAGLCWRFARHAPQLRFIRAGLVLIGAGMVLGEGYVLLRVAFLVAVHQPTGTHFDPAYEAASNLLLAGVSVLVVIGSTLPSWGSTAAAYRDARELFPLWRPMTKVLPGLALDGPATALDDAVPSGDLRRRLTRRVIEVRDGRLQLRRRLRESVAVQARTQAAQAGLDGEDREATVEAARLAVALQEEAAGAPLPPTVPDDTVIGRASLEGEVAWLRRVAAAFAGSPVVRQVAVQEADRLGLPPPPPGPRRSIARVVTEVSAPAPVLVALLLTVGAASADTLVHGLLWGLAAAFFFSLAPMAGVVWGVVGGRLTDHHIGRRTQRPLVMALSLVSFVAGIVIMSRTGAPRELTAAMAALIIAAVVGLAVTLVWKVSIHTAVAGCAASILSIHWGTSVGWIWPALAVVAWARVTVRDHTPAQVMAGAVLGALIAGVAFAVWR